MTVCHTMFQLLVVFIIVGFCSVESVLHGFQANPFDILSEVSIFAKFESSSGYAAVCGGVLIAPNIALTAAHCVYSNNSSILVKLTTRDYDLSKKDEGETTIHSHAVVVHPKYLETRNGRYDVAIVFLTHPIDVCTPNPLSPQVARLPPTKQWKIRETDREFTNKDLHESLCYTAGWGRTENNIYSTVPQEIFVNLKFKKPVGKRLVLAKASQPNARVCMGDSGSPVFCYMGGRRYMVGVVTQIATFGADVNIDEELKLCQDFDHAMIADWRDISPEIFEIIKQYNQLEQLKRGQISCYTS